MGCGASQPGPASAGPSAPPTVPPLALGEVKSTFSATPHDQDSARQPSSAALGRSSKSLQRCNTLELLKGSPQDVLQALLDGNTRFVTGESEFPHQDFTRLQKVAPKQYPIAAILGCADSRVPAEIVFDQGFGDVFVCRVAGNIATAEEIASLEYAVLDLQVRLIMVMGHTSCGAVKAAMSGKAFPGFIDTLIDHLDVAVERAKAKDAHAHAGHRHGAGCDHSLEMIDSVIKENVLYQIERCKRSTIISDAIKKGHLIIVGSVYNLETGQVEMLKSD